MICSKLFDFEVIVILIWYMNVVRASCNNSILFLVGFRTRSSIKSLHFVPSMTNMWVLIQCGPQLLVNDSYGHLVIYNHRWSVINNEFWRRYAFVFTTHVHNVQSSIWVLKLTIRIHLKALLSLVKWCCQFIFKIREFVSY